jgi:hypothetical protein
MLRVGDRNFDIVFTSPKTTIRTPNLIVTTLDGVVVSQPPLLVAPG